MSLYIYDKYCTFNISELFALFALTLIYISLLATGVLACYLEKLKCQFTAISCECHIRGRERKEKQMI